MTFYRRKSIAFLGINIVIVAFLVVFKSFLGGENSEPVQEDAALVFSKESGFYEEAFELELTAESGTIYYTLDGTIPDKNSLKYEKPILITDATDNENVHSMRTDVSTGFEKEEIEKISSGYMGFQVPDYHIDKATIVRAVVFDGKGNYSDVKTASYFIGFSDKACYEGMKTVSIVTDPSNLFDYENGIYVTGKAYDEYVKEYRGGDEYYWREEFWALWSANYRNRGIKWERKAQCQFFDEAGQPLLDQECGIRIHGGVSRGYNPKSMNIYARKEYDGNKRLQADLLETGYYPSAVTFFQGGNDVRTKAKDYVVCAAIKGLNVTTMNYEPYVMFLNGEYWGVYWLNEKYNADYFEYYYGVDKDNVIMVKNGALEEGGDNEENVKYYSKMVELCSRSDVTETETYEKVCEMIDIESYIDYYAVMCYVGRNGDWPWLNFGLWRVKKTEDGPYGDGKWRWIIFDLNSPGFSLDFDSIGYVMEHDEMFKNLMTNDTFRSRLLLRMEELSDTVFDSEAMNKYLDEYQNFMAEPMRENDKRFLGDNSLSDFYAGIEELKNFFAKREEYLAVILDKYVCMPAGLDDI